MKRFLVLLLLVYPILFSAQLSINEFSAHAGIMDNGDEYDWLEIMNTSSSPIELSEYYLTDDNSELDKWQLPEYEIAPSEILVIVASGLDITEKIDHYEAIVLAELEWSYFMGDSEPPANWSHESFNDFSWQVGNGGFGYGDGDDNTEISNTPSIYIRHEFQIDDLENLKNIALYPDYDDAYVAYINGVEIGRSNNIEGSPPSFDTYATLDQEAQLYQALLPIPLSIADEDIADLLIEGNNVLAIQVHNSGFWSSDLSSNFFLTSGIQNQEYNFYPTPEWFVPENANSYFHSNFKLSLNEEIIISDGLGTIIDNKEIDESLSIGISQGRSPDGIGDWCFFDTPSPSLQNGISWCYEGITPQPTGILPSGWYDSEQIIGVDSDATVHYTTNGDIPDEGDPLFDETLEFDTNTTLSVRAFSEENLMPSMVLDRTYIFSEDNHNLPVFSIITDDANLWDWETGIYVSGDGAEPDYPFFGSNFWQPWSKYSRIEYFEADKSKVAEGQLDLEIHGGWSRAEPQKSFRLDFKSKYSGRLEANLFTQKPNITDFNNINIRNGGQHLNSDKMQDGMLSRMINETNADNMAFQPCILYLNGEYWGMYEIREKIDENYIESNHGIPAENVDLMNSNGVLAGSDAHFTETYNLIMAEDPLGENYYALAESRFDLENYMDYFIIETFVQNMDWLGIGWWPNNIKLWHPQTEDGKWRYVIYDTDAGYGYFGQNFNANYLQFARNPLVSNAHSQMFDRMLQNEKFKCEFTNRYADLMNTIFQVDYTTDIAQGLFDEMIGGMPDHVNKWNAPASVGDWQNAVNSILEYAENRLPTARDHVELTLEMQGQLDITLDVYPEGAGSIKISTLIPENYPWDGVYFDGCDVQIIAIPNPGYTFENWSENDILGGISEEEILNLNLFQEDTFTANFAEIPEFVQEMGSDNIFEVYPNPSDGKFFIQRKGETQIKSVKVYNSLGQLLIQYPASTITNKELVEIELEGHPSGIYHLKLETNLGSSTKNIFLQN